MKRTVYFVSESTGITAETMGHSLLSQFDTLDFEQVYMPYINTDLRASIGELLQIFEGLPEDDTNLVIDARGSNYYYGTKSTTGQIVAGDVVVPENI